MNVDADCHLLSGSYNCKVDHFAPQKVLDSLTVGVFGKDSRVGYMPRGLRDKLDAVTTCTLCAKTVSLGLVTLDA